MKKTISIVSAVSAAVLALMPMEGCGQTGTSGTLKYDNSDSEAVHGVGLEYDGSDGKAVHGVSLEYDGSDGKAVYGASLEYGVMMRGETVRMVTSDEPAGSGAALVRNPRKAELTAEEEKELKRAPYLAFSKMKEEGGETVLHCYLHVGKDNMTNIWLGGDDTYIVDDETGVRYKARGSYDPAMWNQAFGVEAPKGTVLDFPIRFPLLPENVTRIRLYGVPKWGFRGTTIWLNRNCKAAYDSIPDLKVPELESSAKNYSRDDMGTYACYKNAHLLAPMEEHTMAAWFTEDATYLSMAFEQNWAKKYFEFRSGTVLIDNSTGRRYGLRKVQGLPLDRLFFVHGVPGDIFALVMEFEPLPLSTEYVDFCEPSGKPFKAWGASWSGMQFPNLSVRMLRANQKMFDYCEREIVE